LLKEYIALKCNPTRRKSDGKKKKVCAYEGFKLVEEINA